MLKNSYGFSRCLFYSIQIEAVCCWEVAVKCEDESLIGCMVEPPFYIADKIEEFEDCCANAKLEFTQVLTCWRFGDWMHQLRGSLLLTEAIEAEAIQRPKTVQDYLKIARRPKTKFWLKTKFLWSYCQGGVCWCIFVTTA